MSGPPASEPRHVASACPLDCPDACSLDVTVQEGRVIEVGGSRVNPITDGYICAKVRRLPEHMYGPARLLRPGIRTGAKGEGRFRDATWDEALGLVAARLLETRARSGGEAILPVSYGGSNGYVSQDTTDARLFYRLGASRLARTVCAAPTARAASGLYGKMTGVAPQDYVHANLIVLWGVNPSVSSIHLVPYVQQAQKRGARLVVIDPRRTRLAARADLHLPVRPGADLPVALGVIRWLFANGRADRAFLAAHARGADELERRAAPWTIERAAAEAGVEAAELETFARMYADASPAAIRCGWGQERNRNGGSATAAILALPAVAGKFGVRGGGYTNSNSPAWRELDGMAAVGEAAPATREINMNRVGDALVKRGRGANAAQNGRAADAAETAAGATQSAGNVDLLFVYNCNPVMTLPNQDLVERGLRREDLFTVVFDPIMTDTARYADVVLPAATFLERTEMSRGYGALVLQLAPPAARPAGEARANHDVFGELCRRTGVARSGEPETAEEIADAILATSARAGELRREIAARGAAFPLEGATPVQFVDAFPNTPDRRVDLVPEELDRECPGGLYHYAPDPGGGDARHPLALISPGTDRTISSTLGELHSAPVPLSLHPDDAAARGIGDGMRVRVFNDLGSVRCRARIDPDLRPGVAFMPKGIWSHNTDSGTTANALAPDTLTDLGGGACFNDARVEVEPAGIP
ncbi:MAG TPA: molybdopterin-dependent oxidoreductase [Thermoanaerobaculia bacterium]|jgi:anaerobic selenocysteine-containing dehydrogenase|nr:molybdopterin-dependent oxidoreductase [Thermoanaerobaculia bacterium]